MEMWEFNQKQSLPYSAKITHAIARAKEFYDEITINRNANVHVSVGGLDSITLLLFLRKYIDQDIKAVSVSSVEDKGNQEIHKLLGVENIKPYKTKTQVLNECGFPVISKEKAAKIHALQNPTEKNKTVRNAIMTGDCGKQGGYRKGTRMRLPQKWLTLFAGTENETYGTNYKTAPFKVSSDCCYYMKEKPCDDWAKEHNSYAYLGLMASEGGQREKALIKNGCNYYGKTTIRSCPFAIFTRQDILQLALDLNVPVPTVYGEIARKEDGTLYTTRAQRTGCDICGFGIHIEKRPHRFDRLREDNPKAWEYYMKNVVNDETTGEKYGWGKVLDYIGVEWETPVGAIKGQMSML